MLVYPKVRSASLETVHLPPFADTDIRIKSLFSGISRGTESLVFNGKIPENEWQRMRCPHQRGNFSFPVSYGYSLVGKVIAVGKSVKKILQGDIIFALHPHQNLIQINETAANRLPDGLAPRRAVLSPNMETALNAIWDSGMGPDDHVSIVGGGVVGLLTAYLAQKISCHPVELIDINEGRRKVAEKLGLHFRLHGDASSGRTRIFHTSAHGEGLQAALDLAAFEGKIIEMSWYGNKPVTLSLGGVFHSKRLQIIASQVGHISPSRRATTDYALRMTEAMSYLDNPALDHLLEAAIPFKALPDHTCQLFGSDSQALCQLIDYGD